MKRPYIKLTKDEIDLAWCRGEIKYTIAKAMNLKPVFTTHDPLLRERLGYLGQIAFSKYVDKLGITDYKEIVALQCKGDSGIDCILKGNTIDVKTAQLTNKFKYMAFDVTWFFNINQQQSRSNIDYFVSVMISKNLKKAFIMGAIRPKKAIEVGTIRTQFHDPLIAVKFKNLYSIKEILIK